jgi:hypothetical protein
MANGSFGLETALATPMLWYPGQDPEEAQYQAALMVERAVAVRAFIDGKITWDDYLCLLEEHRINAIEAHRGWEEGLRYL